MSFSPALRALLVRLVIGAMVRLAGLVVRPTRDPRKDLSNFDLQDIDTAETFLWSTGRTKIARVERASQDNNLA